MKPRLRKTFVCADIEHYTLRQDLTQHHVPQVGDVAVFEVVSPGHLPISQRDTRAVVRLLPGDQLMAAFGHRYIAGLSDRYVPGQQTFHLLSAGGLVSWLPSSHAQIGDGGGTTLRLIGFTTDADGQVINTKARKADWLVAFSGRAAAATNVVLSIRASPGSGKTTTAAHLLQGLVGQGKRVVYIKLTGTVSTTDRDLAYAMGADQALDFSLYGIPSTYLSSENELLSLYETLLDQALDSEPQYVIVELADGLYQRETKMLLQHKAFMRTVRNVIFSAGDPHSAISGVQTLRQWGIEPFALGGLPTGIPALTQSVADAVDLPVLTPNTLRQKGAALLMSQERFRAYNDVPVFRLTQRPERRSAY